MTGSVVLFVVTASALIGIGLWGFLVQAHLLRRVLAFNVVGSGLFLLFGALGWRGGGVDPVPQALVITGIVVALAATAVALWLVGRFAEETGRADLPEDRREDRREDRQEKSSAGGRP